MKRFLSILSLAAALAFPAAAAPKKTDGSDPAKTKPAAEKPDFTGHYERAGDGKSVFILHVRQTGDNAEIEFSASKADGTGAAPEGNGTGSLNEKGELAFTFEDSFGDKGTGTFKKAGGSFQISLKADTVTNPAAVKFYGTVALKKTPNREN